MSDEEILTHCLMRLRASHGIFKMELGFLEAVELIAQLQLALRHPENRGVSADCVRILVRGMIREMERFEPQIGPILRKGFDPSNDVPR